MTEASRKIRISAIMLTTGLCCAVLTQVVFSPSASAGAAPSDPLFVNQWGLSNIGQSIDDPAREDVSHAFYPYLKIGEPRAGVDIQLTKALARASGRPASPVLVGVFDEGVHGDHPDLVGKVRKDLAYTYDSGEAVAPTDATNFLRDPNFDPLTPFNSHGTMIAGIIAASPNNGIGVAGISDHAQIVPLSNYDWKSRKFNIDSAPKIVEYAAEKKIPIVNISWNWGTSKMKEAMRKAKDTLFIVSASNGQSDLDGNGNSYPCEYAKLDKLENVVCVTALKQNGEQVFNYGKESVHLGAPGGSIYSTNISQQVVQTVDSSNWGQYGRQGTNDDDWKEVSAGKYEINATGPKKGYTSYLTSNSAVDLTGKKDCGIQLNVDYKGDADKNGSRIALFASENGASWYTVWDELNNSKMVNSIPLPSKKLHYRLAFSDNDLTVGASAKVIANFVCAPWGGDAKLYAGDYKFGSGTSYATPMVTGVAALVKSYYPNLSTTQLRDVLLSSTRPIESLAAKTITGGMLDADAALARADELYGASKPTETDPATSSPVAKPSEEAAAFPSPSDSGATPSTSGHEPGDAPTPIAGGGLASTGSQVLMLTAAAAVVAGAGTAAVVTSRRRRTKAVGE